MMTQLESQCFDLAKYALAKVKGATSTDVDFLAREIKHRCELMVRSIRTGKDEE